MAIADVFLKEIPLENKVDYKKLCNVSSRGAMHKDEYESLIKYCIKNDIIKIQKYLIAEEVRDAIWDIVDTRGKKEYLLIERMREYPSENDWYIAPFVYILKKIDQNIKINENDKLLIDSNCEIKLRYRVGANATPKIYLPNEKICFNSENDGIDNLMDTIEVDDIELYIIATEDKNLTNKDIVAYKITKSKDFNDLKYRAEHRYLDEFSKYKI